MIIPSEILYWWNEPSWSFVNYLSGTHWWTVYQIGRGAAVCPVISFCAEVSCSAGPRGLPVSVYSWIFFIEFLTIVLLCNDLYISLLLSPLGYSLLPFLFFGVRSNILTSIILVTEEQLCQGRGDHVALASYVTPFFSKKLATKK